jgi:hypothetical protein
VSLSIKQAKPNITRSGNLEGLFDPKNTSKLY